MQPGPYKWNGFQLWAPVNQNTLGHCSFFLGLGWKVDGRSGGIITNEKKTLLNSVNEEFYSLNETTPNVSFVFSNGAARVKGTADSYSFAAFELPNIIFMHLFVSRRKQNCTWFSFSHSLTWRLSFFYLFECNI